MSTPRHRPPVDRLLGIAILLVMAIGLGLVIWGFLRVDQRITTVAETDLLRSIEVVRGRAEKLLAPAEADIDRAAARVQAMDSLAPMALLADWSPLLSGTWGYIGLRLADDQGNETALCRLDSGWALTVTERGSRDSPPIIWRSDRLIPELSEWEPSILDSLMDPRRSVWFSRAIDHAGTDPVWSSVRSRCRKDARTYVLSRIIRTGSPDGPFHVIALELDPAELPRTDQVRSLATRVVPIDEDGVPLRPLTDTVDAGMDEAIGSLLALNKAAALRGFQSLPDHDDRYLVRVEPMGDHGPGWSFAGITDRALLARAFRNERYVLVVAIVLISVLMALLTGIFLRARREAASLEREERRRRSQQKRLAKALGEREVLNREVHHRVKNNLQVVSSLLNIQATRLNEGPVRDEFMRGKQRIDSMALVHHKLYALQDLRGIDLQKFISELIASIAAAHKPRSETISWEVDSAGLKSDPDTAIELGIILAELVNNCFQHAFPFGAGGHIEVTVRNVQDELHRLLVRDNGVGMERAAREGDPDQVRLGLEIAGSLAEQLDGELHVRSTPSGVTAEVLFRMKGS